MRALLYLALGFAVGWLRGRVVPRGQGTANELEAPPLVAEDWRHIFRGGTRL